MRSWLRWRHAHSDRLAYSSSVPDRAPSSTSTNTRKCRSNAGSFRRSVASISGSRSAGMIRMAWPPRSRDLLWRRQLSMRGRSTRRAAPDDDHPAMSVTSSGLLLYRRREQVEVLLVHPGGPFFRNRDDGWWTVPKGLADPGEDALEAARREFGEETGCALPEGAAYVDLGSIEQKGGKVVRAWAVEGDCDPATLSSNTFELEWPPRSGRKRAFPE